MRAAEPAPGDLPDLLPRMLPAKQLEDREIAQASAMRGLLRFAAVSIECDA
ncbi:MAG: hypothetical protein WCP98_23305 [Actinomycetes bacterium]